MAVLNEALSKKANGKVRDFGSVLTQVQGYISNQFAGLLTQTGEEQIRQLKNYMFKYIEDNGLLVEGMSAAELVERLYVEMAGYSIVEQYLNRDDVEEININGWDDVKVTFSDGSKKMTEGKFRNPTHALDVIKRLLRESEIILDKSSPMVRGHLSNKIRITAYMPPVIDESRGVIASIRIVNPRKMRKEDFIKQGTATKEMIELVENVYRYGISVCCTGACSSGKTTFMSYILSTLPDNKRIFTIEEGTREFDLVKRDEEGNVTNNVVHTVTRDSEDARARIDSEKLLEFALTTNPDYICVAEMKGPEAFSAQEAARTGHAVIGTTHTNGAEATYRRLVTLCKMKYDMSDKTLYDLVTEAFPIVMFSKQLEDNSRKIMEIIECCINEDSSREIKTLYRYKVEKTELAENGKIKIMGRFVQENTISPGLARRLRENGMQEEEINRFTVKSDAAGTV